MTELQAWAYSVVALTLLIAVAEYLVEKLRSAKAAQWVFRILLLAQLLVPVDWLMRWLRGER